MISAICRKILDKLNTSGIDVQQTTLRDLVNRKVNLRRPAANIAVNSATFTPITMTTYSVVLEISLIVVLQNLKSEEHARIEVYDILDSIIQAFLLTDLGLDLQDPLTPASFRNITDQKYAEAGFEIYQLNMRCAYNVTKESDEEDWGILTSILTKYYLQPRGYTGMLGVTGPEMQGLIWYEGGSTGVNG